MKKKKRKTKPTKITKKKNFRFWRQFKIRKAKLFSGKRFNQKKEWSSRKATSWMPRFRTKCAKRRQRRKNRNARDLVPRLWAYWNARLVFLLLVFAACPKEEKEKISILLLTRKKKRTRKNGINLVKRKRGRGSQWRTISCISTSLKKKRKMM